MIISNAPLPPPDAPPHARRLPWWETLLISVVLAFMVACIGAAVPSLQTPAGPVLCRSGTFVAGNRSQPTSDGEGTGYDIDSSCVSAATGQAAHVDSFAIVGVLWAEYTLAGFVALTAFIALARAARGTPRTDHTSSGTTSGFTTL